MARLDHPGLLNKKEIKKEGCYEIDLQNACTGLA